MDDKTVLRKALYLLRECGWDKNCRTSEKGLCALAAIYDVVHGDPDIVANGNSAVRALSRAIPSSYDGCWSNGNTQVSLRCSYYHEGRVNVYNNSRTKFSEIEDWFERAIAEIAEWPLNLMNGSLTPS